MNKIKAKVQGEPVVSIGAVVGAIMATLVTLISLNVINLTTEQLESIGKALNDWGALLVLALPIITGLIQRRFVSPYEKEEAEEK